MKQKTGICVDCPAGSGEVPVIAGRCQTHYWRHRSKINANKPSKEARKEQKKELDIYFADQVQKVPGKCQECSKPLIFSQSWMRRAAIAHILPKRPDYGFPSVATHPMNKVFLCLDCHTNMDNLGDVFILKMKIYPTMKDQVQILLPLLTPEERRRVPQYFEL